MERQNQDVDDLSSKISTLGWDEFHILLNPVIPVEDVLTPSLVGKILASRRFSSSVVNATLKAAWTFVKDFSLEEMAPNLFVVLFLKAEDKRGVRPNSLEHSGAAHGV